jgi:uncharacterized damage-inducible protein DinB
MKQMMVMLFAGALTVSAQAPDLKTLSGGAKALHNQTKSAIVSAAEKMKAEDYDFAPTAGVRTFGQLVGHVADSQYFFCSTAAGEKKASPGNEKTKKSKDELVAALKEAMSYCDGVYGATTDENIAQIAKFPGGERTRLNVLSMNTVHNYEHYGNMVTYMRLKGVVPPTSERK